MKITFFYFLLSLIMGCITYQPSPELHAEFEKSKQKMEEAVKKYSLDPIVVIEYDIIHNSIGTPIARIFLCANTDKIISAYEISFNCYDPFGKLLSAYDDGVTTLGTGMVTTPETWHNKGENYDRLQVEYTLFAFNTTTEIKNIHIIRIKFSDGSIWNNPRK